MWVLSVLVFRPGNYPHTLFFFAKTPSVVPRGEPNISRELPANWGGSPLRQITEAQAHALQEQLQQKDKARIYVGMRYWHPFTEERSPELNVTALNAW